MSVSCMNFLFFSDSLESPAFLFLQKGGHLNLFFVFICAIFRGVLAHEAPCFRAAAPGVPGEKYSDAIEIDLAFMAIGEHPS